MSRTLFLSLLALLTPAANAQIGISWSSATNGTIGSHAVSVSGFPGSFLRPCTLISADFSGGTLQNQECMHHDAHDDWTATFAPAIPGLLWYGQNTRGLAGSANGGPTDYTFNVPFEILSGFGLGTVSGTTLSLPPGVYHSGILRFLEPVSTLTCNTTCTESNSQLCTFGQMNIDFDSDYCSPAVANSTGAPTVISAVGSDFAEDNFLTLVATSMPNNSTGVFLTSLTQGFAAMPGGSAGNLCLGGAIGRFVGNGQIKNSGSQGRIELELDLTQHPTPNGLVTVAAGETWNFQAWHRDVVGGATTSNFSSGLSLTFR